MTRRRCCCDGDTPAWPCSGPQPAGMCWRVDFSPGVLGTPAQGCDEHHIYAPGSGPITCPDIWDATLQVIVASPFYVPTNAPITPADGVFIGVYTILPGQLDGLPDTCEGPPADFVRVGDIEVSVNMGCTPAGEWGFNLLRIRVVNLNEPPPYGIDNPEVSTPFLFLWSSGVAVPFGTMVNNQNSCTPGNLPLLGGQATVTPVPCGPTPSFNFLAAHCVTGETITVDINTNTGNKPGIEYMGEAYWLTAEPSDDPPVTVTWTDEVCSSKEVFVAERCSDNASAQQDPATIAYTPTPPLKPGEGSILLTTDIGDGCTRLTYYRPTTTPTAGPPATYLHVSGQPCYYTSRTVCDQPGRPILVGGPEWCDAVSGICAQPDLPAWLENFCDRACSSIKSQEDGGGESIAMTGGESMPSAMIVAQERHLAGPLGQQRRAAGCRGCGDAGGDELA